MLVGFLTFLSENRKIITGAVGTILETIVIIINFRRKLKESGKKLMLDKVSKFKTHLNTFVWSIQPWNLFRKP